MVSRTSTIWYVGLGNHDTGICSAGLHNCDEQGFCLDHHSVVLITDEEIDHLGSGFIFTSMLVTDVGHELCHQYHGHLSVLKYLGML